MRQGNVCKEQTPQFHRYISKKISKAKVITIFNGKENGQCQENRRVLGLFAPFFFLTKRSAAISWQAHQQKGSKNKSKNSELQDTELIVKLICFKSQRLINFTPAGPILPTVISTVISLK